MKLNIDERRAIFAGDHRAIKRYTLPKVKKGDKRVLSWSRGGKQVVDRETGATIDIPRKPTVWIEVTKDPYLKEGRWIVELAVHDEREPTRLLSSAPSGSTEAGLRTRQREKVPPRGTETEHFTPESERGYTGSGRSAIDTVEAVDDDTLRSFSARARSDKAEFQRELEEEEKEAMEEARRKRERAIRNRLRETMAGLDPDEQTALLAAVEQAIERARLLSA